MATKYFIEYLQQNTSLSEEDLNLLLYKCNQIIVEKGEFVQLNQDRKQLLYVQQGLLRYYSIDEKGKEHIIQFAPEGWFISDRLSNWHQNKDDFFIEALEPTTALLLTGDALTALAKRNHDFLELNYQLLNNHVRQLQKRINQLLSYTAEARYLDFIQDYPDIMSRVPQIMVASYLGITPESLSRVRKELAEKNKN